MDASRKHALKDLRDELIRTIQQCEAFRHSSTSNIGVADILIDVKSVVDFVLDGEDNA